MSLPGLHKMCFFLYKKLFVQVKVIESVVVVVRNGKWNGECLLYYGRGWVVQIQYKNSTNWKRKVPTYPDPYVCQILFLLECEDILALACLWQNVIYILEGDIFFKSAKPKQCIFIASYSTWLSLSLVRVVFWEHKNKWIPVNHNKSFCIFS